MAVPPPTSGRSVNPVTNVTISTQVFAKAMKSGIVSKYTECMSLFVLKNSADRRTHAVTVANVPVLNYFLEQGSVLADPHTRNNIARYQVASIEQEQKQFFVHDVDDFKLTWNYLGQMRNDAVAAETGLGGSQHVNPPTGRYGVSLGGGEAVIHPRLLNVDTGLRSRAFNMFAETLRKNDVCRYVAKKCVSPYPYFYDAFGSQIANRTGGAKQIVQVFGFSEGDMDTYYHNTNADEQNPFAPGVDDVDYIELGKRIQQMEHIVSYDDDGYANVEKRVRPYESATDLPEILLDTYREGVVFRVGVVSQPGRSADKDMILHAHRDTNTQINLPISEIMIM